MDTWCYRGLDSLPFTAANHGNSEDNSNIQKFTQRTHQHTRIAETTITCPYSFFAMC